MSTTKKVTYLNDFTDIESINTGIINNSVNMSYAGTFLKSDIGLTRNNINKGIIYSNYCTNLISMNNSYISINLSFPYDIVNGVHSQLKLSNSSYLILGANVGMNCIKTPGISILMTKNGFEYTILSSAGSFTLIDSYSNIMANENMFIEFFWTASSNFPIYDNANIVIRVNGEYVIGGIAPINNDILNNYNFYIFDTLDMANNLECTIKFLSIYNTIPKFIEDELYSSSNSSNSSILDLSTSSSSSTSNSLDSHASIMSSEIDSFLCNIFLKSLGDQGYNKYFDILGMPDFPLSVRKFKTYNIPDRLIISVDNEQIYDTGYVATENNYIEEELTVPGGHELLLIQVVPGIIKNSSWILKIDCEENSSSLSELSESDQSESNQSESDQSESDMSETWNSSISESSASESSASESTMSESSISESSASESELTNSSISESTFQEIELPNRLTVTNTSLYLENRYYTLVTDPDPFGYNYLTRSFGDSYSGLLKFYNNIEGYKDVLLSLQINKTTNQWLINSMTITDFIITSLTDKTGPYITPAPSGYYCNINSELNYFAMVVTPYEGVEGDISSSHSESSISESSISESGVTNSSISESSFSESSASESSISESSQSESSESDSDLESQQSESTESESDQSESTESVSYLESWWESQSDQSESDRSESEKSESDRSESEISESSRSEKSESDQSESNESESDQSESWNSSQSESTESESDKDQSESTESVSYLKPWWESQSDQSESDRSESDLPDYGDHVYFLSPNNGSNRNKMLKINTRNDTISLINSMDGYYGYGVINKNSSRKNLYLCPSNLYHQRSIIKFDTINETYSYVGTATTSSYAGAAVVGTSVYFAPESSSQWGAEAILKLNTLTNTTSYIPSEDSYRGCVAVGTDIYFAPCGYTLQPSGTIIHRRILKLDTLTDTVSYIGDPSGYAGYSGCVAIGTDVYFAPSWNNTAILKLDTLTNTALTVSGPFRDKDYDGCAVVGTNIYFAPLYAGRILKFDTLTGVESLVGENYYYGTSLYRYSGCIAHRTNIYFAPRGTVQVLKLDTLTDTTSLIVHAQDYLHGFWHI